MKKALALLLVLLLVLSLAACGESEGGSRDRDDDDESTKGSHSGSAWEGFFDKTDDDDRDDDDDDGHDLPPTVYVGADECGDYDLVSVPGYDHQFKKYANMTRLPITLRYATYDDETLVRELADVFMEIYPNITVEVTQADGSEYDDFLSQLFRNGQTPDAFMYIDADYVLSNHLLLDVSGYWNTDEETKDLMSTVNDMGLGTFNLQGGQRYGVPVNLYPQPVFLDRKALKTLNIPIPAYDWTWDEMINIIKAGTNPAYLDGMWYYGIYGYTRLAPLYAIAVGSDAVGSFGFDGFDYDLSAWAIGEQEYGDLRVGGYTAPDLGTVKNEDWMGDPDLWCGLSGHVALFTEPFYIYQNIWLLDNGVGGTLMESGNLDIVPYVVPAVSAEDARRVHNTPAIMDFGGVSSSTQYPREAYELLKFMSFGLDGWTVRCGLYEDTSVTDGGTPLRQCAMPVPLTKDQDIWDAYVRMFCEGMDQEHTQLWRDYFAACVQPIPFEGVSTIAGYTAFMDEWFDPVGIDTMVDAGFARAADYVDEATREANWHHASAMLDYFGPDGYDVLTAEEIDSYSWLYRNNE